MKKQISEYGGEGGRLCVAAVYYLEDSSNGPTKETHEHDEVSSSLKGNGDVLVNRSDEIDNVFEWFEYHIVSAMKMCLKYVMN